jgi:hypothetical protein
MPTARPVAADPVPKGSYLRDRGLVMVVADRGFLANEINDALLDDVERICRVNRLSETDQSE